MTLMNKVTTWVLGVTVVVAGGVTVVLARERPSPAHEAQQASGASGEPAAATPPGDPSKRPTLLPVPAAHEAVAVFAGGCFWCMETAFEGQPGVSSVTSGFTGGPSRNPTYDQVSAGGTGHAEAVRVVYEPRRISYEKLLELFWHNVDPVSAGGQFCDRGSQYRSAIYYGNAAEKALAERSRAALAPRFAPRPIATELAPLGEFYAAEEYHQDFYKKDPARYQSYRRGCGRDRRLRELWGDAAPRH